MTRTAEPPLSAKVSGLLQRRCACGGSAGKDGECEECKKKRLQRKVSSSLTPAQAPASVSAVLQSPGRPLDAQTRSFMEPRFGHDFSQVRIHSDGQAADSARAVSAHAYTVGSHVVFDTGRYAPSSASGRNLLAHELTHVVQQSRSPSSGANGIAIAPENDAAEREADAHARQVSAGLGVRPSVLESCGTIQRQAAPGAGNAPAGTPAPQPPRPPGTRQFVNFTRSGFGMFDATLESRGRVNAPGARGFLCALLVNTRVKFSPSGPWPNGAFQTWKQRFIQMVSRHWSTRYLLVPARPCPNEGCSTIAVYVAIEEVTAGEHHNITVDYIAGDSARSDAGSPGTPGHFYRRDTDERGGLHRHRTAYHEAGHWFGNTHIHCRSGNDECYGTTYGESDDVMGRGDYVSARDYQPFVDVTNSMPGMSCVWRVPEGQGGSRAGSFILPLAILGGLLGGFLGLAVGLGVGLGGLALAGITLGGAAVFGGLGALIGRDVNRAN